jgi:hypothetical protein
VYVGLALDIVPGLAIVPGAMVPIAPGDGDAQFVGFVESSLIELLEAVMDELGDALGHAVVDDVGAAGFASTTATDAATAKAPSTTKLLNLLFIDWSSQRPAITREAEQ